MRKYAPFSIQGQGVIAEITVQYSVHSGWGGERPFFRKEDNGLTAHTLYILGGGVEAVGGPEDPEEEDIEKGG